MKNIVNLQIDDLIDFSEHPFKVFEDEDMLELVESIKENGVAECYMMLICTLKNTDFKKYQQ